MVNIPSFLESLTFCAILFDGSFVIGLRAIRAVFSVECSGIAARVGGSAHARNHSVLLQDDNILARGVLDASIEGVQHAPLDAVVTEERCPKG